MDEFISAKRGVIHRSFWQSLYKLDDKSGGTYISGWIIKFFPYLNSEDGKPILNQYVEQDPIENSEWKTGLTIHDFFNGISQVDFEWQYLGKKMNMAFIGGFIGITQNKTDLTLRPAIGWAVKRQKKQ